MTGEEKAQESPAKESVKAEAKAEAKAPEAKAEEAAKKPEKGAGRRAAGGAGAKAERTTHVRVVLRDDVEKLGRVGEMVEVRRGYARNYLIPMGLAFAAGPEAEKRIGAEKRRRAVREKKRVENMAELAKKLVGLSINVTAKADGENLYGSVGPKEIVAAILNEHKHELPESAVVLEEHIKKTGVYDVVLRLAPDAEANIRVWVVAE